jgi:hypothetical protein
MVMSDIVIQNLKQKKKNKKKMQLFLFAIKEKIFRAFSKWLR